MRLITCLLLWLLVAMPVLAQTVAEKNATDDAYPVPFASKDNAVELTVANPTGVPIGPIHIEAEEAPSWLLLEPEAVTLKSVAADSEAVAHFRFGLEKTAPVGVHMLRFAVRVGEEVVFKEIRLAVEAPRAVVLRPNYPNPFNPRTKLGYELPVAGRVQLRVYDVLGREVVRLVSDEQKAGYHEAVWEAGRYASGWYLARLVVDGSEGRRTVKQQTMLLVK